MMIKDKEWLERNVNITLELAGDRGIFYSPRMSRILYDDLVELINKLDEPEQEIIPQFVADYIQIYKKDGLNLLGLLDNIKKHKKISDWCVQIDGSYSFRTIAKAWLEDYTVEQPKLLTVIVKDYDKTIMSKQLPEDEVNKMMEGLG